MQLVYREVKNDSLTFRFACECVRQQALCFSYLWSPYKVHFSSPKGKLHEIQIPEKK